MKSYLAHKRWDGGRVGSEAHADDHGVFLAKETSSHAFEFHQHVSGASLGTRAGDGQAVLQGGLLDGIGTCAFVVGKAQVVVRCQVEVFGDPARETTQKGISVFQNEGREGKKG